METRETQNYYV